MDVKKCYSKSTSLVFTLTRHSRIFFTSNQSNTVQSCSLVISSSVSVREYQTQTEGSCATEVTLSRDKSHGEEVEKKHNIIRKPLPWIQNHSTNEHRVKNGPLFQTRTPRATLQCSRQSPWTAPPSCVQFDCVYCSCGGLCLRVRECRIDRELFSQHFQRAAIRETLHLRTAPARLEDRQLQGRPDQPETMESLSELYSEVTALQAPSGLNVSSLKCKL